MTRPVVARAAVLLIVTLTACADFFTESLTGKLGLSGRYQLATIDGVALPSSSGTVVIDSGFFEVRPGNEVFFQDYYHASGSSVSQIRTGLYELDEAESGTIYGMTRTELPEFGAPVFSHATTSVTITGTRSLSPLSIATRVYSR